ncbi:MAG: isoprenylcysteine carboxylmethyltransferase family protein [Candidatus Marinimicrobia bacterium]|nr:isoprenylcysteine carboxylmethyltransferase family protein [Candidatus Neomarinimicrobiota bacterium]
MKSNRLGNVFFRYRSFTPLPLAIIIIWQAQLEWPWANAGIVLVIFGEAIRLTAVRASGKITRTRKVGAPQLVTWGLYSAIRNPLYLGNLLMWLGATLFAGGSYMHWLLLAVLIMFGIQYSLIVALEEATLSNLFGARYTEYCQAVPRIVPRFTGRSARQLDLARPPEEGLHPWKYAFESESSTLLVVIGVLVIIAGQFILAL